jgi:hypothetical protein
MQAALILFLVGFLFVGENGALQILSPERLVDKYNYQSTRLDILPKTFNLTGRLVLADPTPACGDLKNADKVRGNIVFARYNGSNF